MKAKSHVLQLLETLDGGREQKTPLAVNSVLFESGGSEKRRQIRFSNLIQGDFQNKKQNTGASLANSYSISVPERRKN